MFYVTYFMFYFSPFEAVAEVTRSGAVGCSIDVNLNRVKREKVSENEHLVFENGHFSIGRISYMAHIQYQ